jgi:Cdc6-like AAA superfamily ATPase
VVSATIDLDLDHLRPHARAHAMEDDEARIRHIRIDRFVPFARAVEGLNLLEELLAYPERTCMPNLLIHADAGMGKTMLAAKFRRDHPPDFDEERGTAIRPVIFVDMPPVPDEGRFFSRLLESVGAPFEARATIARKEALALNLLPQLRPRMLMIDEVQHLLSGGYRAQRQALNLIKSLGNHLRVPIVALGTQDALTAIRTDPQIDSRFWTFEITRWREDDELRALLATVQTALPLRRASALDERAMLRLILAHTGGVTRDMFRLIGRAAELAISTGREHIDDELLETAAVAERRAR